MTGPKRAPVASRTYSAQALAEGEVSAPEPIGDAVTLNAGDVCLAFDWGEAHELGTPAYWTDQTRRRGQSGDYRLGRSLREELAACLLGGYGIKARVGLAAFAHLRSCRVLASGATEAEIAERLHEPLDIDGRPVSYRFPNQRAQRLAAALRVFDASGPAPEDPEALRGWLLALPGVGPKTAAWIVRNVTSTNSVAIVDVHVRRAGLAAGFFAADWTLPKDYGSYETCFLAVAALGAVNAGELDACIWNQLQALGPAKDVFFGGRLG